MFLFIYHHQHSISRNMKCVAEHSPDRHPVYGSKRPISNQPNYRNCYRNDQNQHHLRSCGIILLIEKHTHG